MGAESADVTGDAAPVVPVTELRRSAAAESGELEEGGGSGALRKGWEKNSSKEVR